MELTRYGKLETHCECVDVEVWSSGGALQALPLCLKRSGALEACCTCRDMEEEAQRYRSSGDAL